MLKLKNLKIRKTKYLHSKKILLFLISIINFILDINIMKGNNCIIMLKYKYLLISQELKKTHQGF